MPNFSIRSQQAELLDGQELDTEELHRNLYELEVINRLLGGHRATILGLNQLVQQNQKITIADFGCGGGDTLRHIHQWASKKNLDVELIGYDLLPEAIDYAESQTPKNWGIDYRASNFHDISSDEQFDIVISSLFTHHLYDDDLTQVLQKKWTQSRLGFIINDLHRHPLAYHSIKVLTRLLSKSAYVKNDAPLSVAKGFKKQEWASLLEEAGIDHFEIQWVWAFRHLVIGYHRV